MVSIFDRIASATDRLAHAWNVFVDKDGTYSGRRDFMSYGAGYATRPDRKRMSAGNDRSIIASIYNRLGVDIASYEWRHAMVDENDNFVEEINSKLNDCISLRANVDQSARAFKQDVAMTIFERGVAAIVPIDTSTNPEMTGAYDIETMRVGEVVQWYPRHVRVKLWNDINGRFQEVTVPKSTVAIVENPFYQVMNEPNSTLQRLIRKLNILDLVDEASSSGKLDIIIQLPYVVKNETKREQARQRAEDIEMQLRGSKYGIAYTDGSERITQLNRPAENNLLNQIQHLEKKLYGELGLPEEIFIGNPNEQAMLNYYNRTIEPVLVSITEAMRWAFLTKNGRTRGQSIVYFRDPFKLVPVGNIADIADKFRRNEIMTSNEIRGKLGLRPRKDDPKADTLSNPNMPEPEGIEEAPPGDPGLAPNAEPSDPGIGNLTLDQIR